MRIPFINGQARVYPMGLALTNPKFVVVMANSMVYPQSISGGDRIFVEICKRLDTNRYRISVVTTEVGHKLWKEAVPSDKIIKLQTSFLDRLCIRAFVPLMYFVRLIRACRTKIQLINRLIVYSSSDYICDTIPSLYMKKKNSNAFWIARIYHVIPGPGRRRGNLLLNVFSFVGQRLSFWIIAQKADLILVLTKSLGEELVQIGFPKERIGISGGGINFGSIICARRRQTALYDGVFLGRLHANKGIFDLIDIWERVVYRKKNARLAVIGGGDHNMILSVTRQINRYNLEKNVDLLGFVPDDKRVYEILKSSKIFLFTDHENGWSLATCEAMACGLPVIAYDLEIFGTVFKRGFITVSFLNLKKFSETVLNLLNDEDKRLELANEAYEQAKAFDWDTTALNFARLLDRL